MQYSYINKMLLCLLLVPGSQLLSHHHHGFGFMGGALMGTALGGAMGGQHGALIGFSAGLTAGALADMSAHDCCHHDVCEPHYVPVTRVYHTTTHVHTNTSHDRATCIDAIKHLEHKLLRANRYIAPLEERIAGQQSEIKRLSHGRVTHIESYNDGCAYDVTESSYADLASMDWYELKTEEAFLRDALHETQTYTRSLERTVARNNDMVCSLRRHRYHHGSIIVRS